MKTWQATRAKRYFSQIIDESVREPQVVMRRGKPAGVMISYDEFIQRESMKVTKTMKDWLEELIIINKSEGDLDEIIRSDRDQPEWE